MFHCCNFWSISFLLIIAFVTWVIFQEWHWMKNMRKKQVFNPVLSMCFSIFSLNTTESAFSILEWVEDSFSFCFVDAIFIMKDFSNLFFFSCFSNIISGGYQTSMFISLLNFFLEKLLWRNFFPISKYIYNSSKNSKNEEKWFHVFLCT